MAAELTDEKNAMRATALGFARTKLAVGFQVADEALQLHAEYGHLAECEAEKIVRDLRVHRTLEGANEIMRLIIARALVDPSY
jgi:alkylation response protein AidB-like acyl-CoA dehydrogenase